MRVMIAISLAAACALLGVAASCTSTSDDRVASDASASAPSDAAPSDSSSPDAEDAAVDHAIGEVTCDAAIIECTTTPTRTSPTVNTPTACGAPAYDSYATNGSNEQVEAACNAFCQMQNPSYADAGGFIGCNQTSAEQALGTGAFHCVCAP